MRNRFIKAAVLLLLFFVYFPWLVVSKTLSSGDWPYLFRETVIGFSFAPNPSFLWLGPYYQITSKIFVEYLHIPWEISEKVWWFWMFLVISFFSSWYLAKNILGRSQICFVTILIFLTNTYILMIVGGGQMGFALAYALSPATLAGFIELAGMSQIAIGWKDRIFNRKFITFSLLWGLQTMFDPRAFYVVCIAGFLYFLISLLIAREYKRQLASFSIYCLFGGIIVLICNSPWILARVLSKSTNFLADASSGSIGSLSFFSFGSFSHAFALLHPNWPENIFGKTYFLKPEFLVLPLLAFGSLLFLTKEEKKKKEMLFFSLLGLLGIFLSKGVLEPFGEIYRWMFSHVPGFVLFRDPTKFYLLIVLSYAILIPYCLEKLSEKISSRFHFEKVVSVPIVLFLVAWVFLIRAAVFGQLSGTFKPHSVPFEYLAYKEFILSRQGPFKTLWVPRVQRFGLSTESHTAISAYDLFHVSSSYTFRIALADGSVQKLLRDEHFRYVIVPLDSEREIFIDDRKYSEKEYQKTVKMLEELPWLTLERDFGRIKIFRVTASYLTGKREGKVLK